MISLLSPIVIKLIAGAVVLAVIGGGVAWWSIREYNKGYASCVAAVAAADQAALDRVKAGQEDIAKCRADGRTWDVTTGRCQ